MGELEKQAVWRVLESGRLSLGPALTEFEGMLAARAGRRYAIAVNSGTSGLHLCVRAAGLQRGDEAVTTPFSFVASANCLLYQGAMPRFVDIDPDTYNLDVRQLPDAITPRTRALLPVHVFGRCCEMEPLLALARRHGLWVIEDACEALGAHYRGTPAGGLGDTAVFAFYPNKQITTGEGGAVVTDDPGVATLCRSWRNQGRDDGGAWLIHQRLGYNYRLSELNCALGIAQLGRLEQILAARARVAERYTRWLREQVPEVALPPPAAAGSRISWFVYVVRLRSEFSAEDRVRVMEHLRGLGIGCSHYFAPIHLQPVYQDLFHYRRGSFPAAEAVGDRTIALPFFNRLSDGQIETVCQALKQAIHRLKHRGVAAVPVGSEVARAASRLAPVAGD